jgi:N6-L-threonylcarbamoyladenine synthase
VIRVLAIESSCDETAAAVVDDGHVVRSSVVSTQGDLHAPYGGVVPEIASRAHLECIVPVVRRALADAACPLDSIDVVAATQGPGLSGALLVGLCAAKALALAAGRPFVGVHHHEAHVFAALLDEPSLEPPFVTLVVSGGHTMIVAVDDLGRYRVLGRTVDDAAGEAFDKVARVLGLGYPGGPLIDALAVSGDPGRVRLPRPMLDDGYDFSFSGLKTAVVRALRDDPDLDVADVAAGFQAAAVEVLVTKLVRAAQAESVPTVVIGGGVAANSALRQAVADAAQAAGLRAVVPARSWCTDNAAMVAAAAHHRFTTQGPSALDAGVRPTWPLG